MYRDFLFLKGVRHFDSMGRIILKDKSIFKTISLIPFRTAFFVLVGVLLYCFTKSSFDELSKWWTVIVSVCNIVTILLLLLICRSKGTTYGKFINYEKGKSKIATVIIAIIVVLVVGMGGMQLAGLLCYGELPHFPIMMIQPIPLWIAILNIFVLPLTTTLAEDGIYIGVLNQSESKTVLVVSMLFYALQHSFIPFVPDWTFVFYRFCSFLPLTIIMCLWYRKHKNPLPFMIGHFVINLATVGQVLMTSAAPEVFDLMKSLS